MIANLVGGNAAVDKEMAVDSEEDNDSNFDPNNPNDNQVVDVSDKEAEPLPVKSDDDRVINLAESNKEAKLVECNDNESDNDNHKDVNAMIASQAKENRELRSKICSS